ncbi:MAG TPA: polyprenyl diphosphate synthase [Candidatus Babeliales bacterium]|nr:polyprenyl diphosphate synthase [Candidatus Babeliales bacterium]
MMKHLACIMDGNRRWAKQKGWRSYQGHREGVEAVKRVAQFCLDRNIPYLSLYTFSIENFNRSEQEKEFLFNLIIDGAQQSLEEFLKQGIRIRFIGDRSLFPASVLSTCQLLEQQTAHLTKLNLNFLFCYGARQEIVGGIKTLVRKVMEGIISEDEISPELFRECLWTKDIPEPDLIIRTGNVKRLSNFLLYQAAYSEFYFLDCLWPELTTEHLEAALTSYNNCQRNFGS